jgi:hypothetical protein
MKLTKLAIMPGRNPLGLCVPRGIDSNMEERAQAFYAQHGVLPIIVLSPRELRPGEALSWTAFLTTGEGFPRWDTGEEQPVFSNQLEPVVKGATAVNKINAVTDTAPRGRGRPEKVIPPEILDGPGSLRKKAELAGVSYEKVRQAMGQGELGL